MVKSWTFLLVYEYQIFCNMVDLRDGNEGLKIGSWQISGA
jgi:hypothetical protein